MKMKKIVFKIVLLAAVVLLYACGNQSKETKKTPNTQENPKVEAVESHEGKESNWVLMRENFGRQIKKLQLVYKI